MGSVRERIEHDQRHAAEKIVPTSGRRTALSAGGSVSTRQTQERRNDAANPEVAVHREVTSSASCDFGNADSFSRVRDRLSLAAEMKPEARPKTDAELAAEQGLADWNKRRADDEAERQRRVASGKIIYRN